MTRIADLILARGSALAQGQADSGAIWGNAIQNLGQTFAQVPGQIQAGREADRARQAAAEQESNLSRILMSPNPDPRDILSVAGPERGLKIVQGLQAFGELQSKGVKDARDTAGRLALGLRQLSPEMRAQLAPAVRQAAIDGGLGDAASIPEDLNDQFLDGVIAWGTGKAPEQPKAPEAFTLSEGQTRFGPDGKPIANVAKPPEAPKPVTYGAPEFYRVPGKKEPIQLRAGSDGKMYDTSGQVVTGALPYQAPSNAAPGYVTLTAPDGKSQRRVTDANADILMQKGWTQGGSGSQLAGTQSAYSAERAQRVVQSIDELDKLVSPWTTGYGSLFAKMPASDARQFARKLDTLKANIAFNELTQMREASKTGGALGNVAIRELELLESTLGALDAGMDGKDLKAEFKKIKKSVQRWNTAASGQGGQPAAAKAPAEGTAGTVNGQPAVWKTVNGVAGWYAR